MAMVSGHDRRLGPSPRGLSSCPESSITISASVIHILPRQPHNGYILIDDRPDAGRRRVPMFAPKRPLMLAASFLTLATTLPACGAPKVMKKVDVTVASSTRDARSARASHRMGWWHKAKFGMCIHWGLYAVPAGTYNGQRVDGIGEWIMHNGKIPVSTYADYAKEFDPTKFDADTWVSIAKAAGMKYIVMTAKHHDGFAMYHSAVDSYN